MSTYSTMAGAAAEPPDGSGVLHWTVDETEQWLRLEGFGDRVVDLLCRKHKIIGKVLLVLNEHDFTVEPLNQLSLTDRKCLYISCRTLQRDNQDVLLDLGLIDLPINSAHLVVPSGGCGNCAASGGAHPLAYINPRDMMMMTAAGGATAGVGVCSEYCESERNSPPMSYDGRSTRLPPEKLKAFLAFCYVVAVTWITAFVMVIVHERVPDMQKYPPLPDIFLDNVPHIPWAFDMCEVAGTVLFTVWLVVLLFHKHRFILMRRFFALSGTVFLLRCVTMLITSLSVPGQHLKCQPRNFATGSSVFSDLAYKLQQAYFIWRGAGMSIQGVRTCGDYMFSGHTVALTMLNFFITEYTPRYIYYLHTLSWMMNMFGIFFILAAHEHYSIDVFVAFYITSRLFLYYHTLANNQSLILRDYSRTKVWFPLFSYFESGVDGIVPNEYETPAQICWNLVTFVRVKLVALHQLVFSPPNGDIPTAAAAAAPLIPSGGAHHFSQHGTPRRHSRMPSTGGGNAAAFNNSVVTSQATAVASPPTPITRTSNHNNNNSNSSVVSDSSPNDSPSKKKQQ